MRRARHRGFTLLEVLVALALLAVAMTALLVAFVASGQLGNLSRRQATALALAKSLAVQIGRAAYTDARLNNSNTGNDATFADPNSLFEAAAVPTGTDAPDGNLGTFTVGGESFDAYVNVSPQQDGTGAEQGKQFAVIVRYKVASKVMRAVVLGYRYNPAVVGVGTLPI